MVPVGLKGLAFAALAAAIVSSLASMLNSTSTIFTMDIYRNYIEKNASQRKLVRVGRLTSFIALLVAVVAARPMLGGLDQAFQFIQEFTGMVTPAVCVIFIGGLFWKRATANAALWAAVLSIPVSWLFKILLPMVPFMNRMGYVAILLTFVYVGISYLETRHLKDIKELDVEKSLFHTGRTFNIASVVIIGILIFLYVTFW
jgi:SSS family solute:Na+ symporter